jgi:hypothetical protein
MKLVRVKKVNAWLWHYALESEMRPVCGCGCKAPSLPRKRGAGLCACFCHSVGSLKTKTLCEKLTEKRIRIALNNGEQAALDFYRRTIPTQVALPFATVNVEEWSPYPNKGPWKIVVGRGPGCQTCAVLGMKLTKGDVLWLINRIEEKRNQGK